MCFGSKKPPKMKPPKMQPIKQNSAPPIEQQTPSVSSGAEQADAERSKKRRENPNSALSLFQIQLIPGASTGTEEPGAADTPM